ncbi:MAG: ATP-binding protein [Rhizobiaceae bacterium]
MLPSELVSKPVHEWTLDDLNLIVERQSEESQFLEFKEHMPVKNQGLGWNFNGILHANQRDGLAKEIVAFANAYGGHLIVGIKETEEKPSRAERLGDVNNDVAELAERLRSALNSVIDPPINGLGIQPIISSSSGGCFLAINVPRSTHAPHGFGKPPEAYMRRADRSEPMTMRDMENVFWEARTRRERVAGEFAKAKEGFIRKELQRGELQVAFIAVSETPCFSDSLLEAVSVRNPRKWAGIYQVPGGGIFRGPENCPDGWMPDINGLRTGFDSDERSELWQLDETGIVSLNFSFLG